MKTSYPYTDLQPNHAWYLYRYLEFGSRPTPFLEAILSNNLASAVVASELEDQRAIPALVKWLLNYVPQEAWGSERSVSAWKKRGGFRGRNWWWNLGETLAFQ